MYSKKYRYTTILAWLTVIVLLITIAWEIWPGTRFNNQDKFTSLPISAFQKMPVQNAPWGIIQTNTVFVTIPKQGPMYYKTTPVTLDMLKREFDSVFEMPQMTVVIRADREAAFGRVVQVIEAAEKANISDRTFFCLIPAPDSPSP
jgi:hypothetical protein